MYTPLPPLPTQKAIADFLDRKTAAIDALIEKKERLLELLAEKRAALIHRAVTRGLDPDVPMKDSGVPWIGEIPRHWEVKRLSHVTRIFRGRFSHRPRNAPHLYDGDVPFLQTGDIARASREVSSYKQTLSPEGVAVSKVFSAGTIVMAIAANVGDVARLGFAACCPDSVVGFSPWRGVSSDFLLFALEGLRPALDECATENTQRNLNIERISALRIPVPPIEEQVSASEALEALNSGTEELASRIKKQVARLREYRQSIITAAVTGQLDIPEAAA